MHTPVNKSCAIIPIVIYCLLASSCKKPEERLGDIRINVCIDTLSRRIDLALKEKRPFELIEWEATNLVVVLNQPLLVEQSEVAFVESYTMWRISEYARAVSNTNAVIVYSNLVERPFRNIQKTNMTYVILDKVFRKMKGNQLQ